MSIREYEFGIRNRSIEVAYVLTPGGELLFSKNGDFNSIEFSENELRLIAGNILTHNHPSGSSFSEEDVRFLLANLPIELRVVTAKYRHSLLLPRDPGMVFFRLRSTVDRIYVQVQTEFREALKQRNISRVEANQQFWHQVWVSVSEELGLDYYREEWLDES